MHSQTQPAEAFFETQPLLLASLCFSETFIHLHTKKRIEEALHLAKEKFPNVVHGANETQYRDAMQVIEIIFAFEPQKIPQAIQLIKEGKTTELEILTRSTFDNARKMVNVAENPFIAEQIDFSLKIVEAQLPNIISIASSNRAVNEAYVTSIYPFRQTIVDSLKKMLEDISFDNLPLPAHAITYLKALLAYKIASLRGNSHGFCGELTCPVFFSLAQNQLISTPIELVTIINTENTTEQGNHVIVICNRKRDLSDPAKDASLQNLRNWGKDCYVCDPYNDAYYKFSEMPQDSILQFAMRFPQNYSLHFSLTNSFHVVTDPDLTTLNTEIINANSIHELEEILGKYAATANRILKP